MSYVKKGDNKGDETQQVHKIRIKLSSRNAKALEKVCADLMLRAKEHKIKARGPVRLPTRTLRLTVRKSPCGNGTASYDNYQLAIYKRLIDFYAPQDAVKQITSINMEAGVDVDVTVEQA